MSLTPLDLLKPFGVELIDFEKASQYQAKHGGRIENILVNMGALSEEAVPLYISSLLELPLISAENVLIDEYKYSDADFAFLLSKQWLPLVSDDDSLCKFAAVYPLDLEVNDWLSALQTEYQVSVISDAEFNAVQGLLNSKVLESDSEFEFDGAEEEKLKELASEAPTVNMLNSLMSRAVRAGASDMHLEPIGNKYRVRYRIDGVLHEVDTIPPKMKMPIVTRLKILSGMDIAEKRRPQDGKIETKVSNQEIDIRVSSLPLNDGESIVMRFLKKENVTYDMSVLELSNDIEQLIKSDIKKTSGVVLLTGPTGSGKTTTLYTFLNALNSTDVKIITLEDPVEYQLPGINQVQVNSDIGFTFAAGLRSIVRQDPDVIMLGEIRDKETAQIALQSALTGHLVFSTVHTNDAASAFTRLLDLGVEEFLLNAALVSIVAQRLARKVCDSCAQPVNNAEQLIQQYKLDELAKRNGITDIKLMHGAGCEKCSNTGYKGRMAIVEYLQCDEHIKALPKNESFLSEARSYSKSINRRSLFEDGCLKAILGQTTIEEVIRVAG